MKHPEARPPYEQPDKGQCRWCWGVVRKPRRTFCSAACLEEYRLEVDWDFIAGHVFKRDRGVCVLCRCDTEKMRRVFSAWRDDAKRRDEYVYQEAEALMRQLGMHPSTTVQYQIDHIQPRHDGGTDALSNLRTLCVACHAGVTAAFARERARRRRDAAASMFHGEVT